MQGWQGWRDRGGLKKVLPGPAEIRYWSELLDKVYAEEVDSWACRWTLSCWRHDMVTALPNVNLISNIGFGPAATHTFGKSRFSQIPLQDIIFPLKHPEAIKANTEADRYTGRMMFRPLTFFRKLDVFLRGR